MLSETWLADSAYPGRGIVIGASQDGVYGLQIYWAMGRSAKTRNRVMVSAGDLEVRTELATPDLDVGDTSLILYRAMARAGDVDVVSNGEQTEALVTGIGAGVSFGDLSQDWEVEPDPPNYTARIAGVLDWQRRSYQLAAVRAPQNDPECQATHVSAYRTLLPGRGHCITTYAGDGHPLPPFHGEPFPVHLGEDPVAVAEHFWSLLDDDNRVALAVKAVSLETGEAAIHVINAYPVAA